jgi:hypothetical protein
VDEKVEKEKRRSRCPCRPVLNGRHAGPPLTRFSDVYKKAPPRSRKHLWLPRPCLRVTLLPPVFINPVFPVPLTWRQNVFLCTAYCNGYANPRSNR